MIALGSKKIGNLSVENKKIEKAYLGDKLVYSSRPKIYGVKRQISSSSTEWIRIEDSVGLVAEATHDGNPVRNDFDNIYPWSEIKTVDISENGTINRTIDDPDYDPVNPIGYIMTEFPEFWYGRTQGNGWEYIYISQFQTDLTPNLSKKFYLGRYTAGGTSSAIASKSGVENLVSISIVDFRTAAKKVGSNWGQLDILRWSILQMLYLVEYADYDSQKTLGNGVSNASAKINTGACDSLGMKSGCLADDKKSAVIYRGIENIFGNIYQWCDGINIKDYYSWVCYDPSKYESDKFASPYVKMGYQDANSSGYITQIGYDATNPEIQRASATGGAEGTYVPDYFYSASSAFVVYVGGFSFGAHCGLWYADDSASSYTSSVIGGRLLFVPE